MLTLWYSRACNQLFLLYCPGIFLSSRLPLPAAPGWMIVAVDLNQILSAYCVSAATTARTPVPQLHTVRKIQLCSNMLVRDVVTSDKMYPPDPKVAYHYSLAITAASTCAAATGGYCY
jgi:hypothetical protein